VRVAVLGAGAMGSLYAGMLARAERDVWLVGRSRPHVDAIRANGLRLSTPDGAIDWRIPVRATTNAAKVGPVDLVILLTKTHDMGAAAAGASVLFGPDTLALPLANGLGGPEAVRDALPNTPIACGVSEVGGDIVAPGHLQITENVAAGRGHTRFGVHSGAIDPDQLHAVADMLETSGLRAEVRDDVLAIIWTKLAMAGSMSSLSALSRLRIGPIAGSAEGWRLLNAMVTEIASVAAAQGIAIDASEILTRARSVFEAVPAHVPSMAADLRERRRTENNALAGAVAREGARLGVPTPICSMASDLIALVERHPGESLW
jgi:2-dehydropantoate 2-reductase